MRSTTALPANVSLGDYAFAIYLWTVPLEHFMSGIHFGFFEYNTSVLFILIVVVFSGVYTHFVEKPAVAWFRRKAKPWIDGTAPLAVKGDLGGPLVEEGSRAGDGCFGCAA